MGAVIITTRGILWVVLTVISTILVFTAVITPRWLVGATRNSGGYRDASISYGRSGYGTNYGGNSPYGIPYGSQLGDRYNNGDRYNSGGRYDSGYNNGWGRDRDADRYSSHYNSIYSDYYTDDKPSVGLYNRCTYINNLYNCASLASEGWGNNSGVFPVSWKVSLFFFIVGLGIMCITIAMAVMSCCVQHCFKKSIFTLAGWLQNVAGVLFVLGLLIYMFGWGTKRVERLCGRDSGSFMTGECSLGWAFYTAIIGIVLTFISGCLSMAAQKATTSDQTLPAAKPY
ncbi:LHFPL tetraspan subfamily member 2 protein isoform X2 [Bemisia tabaci]|uniref:LHFPL tetraspan subfamily member 2 protein isoform X2 n=1 Tax=Bemisia tabaci TaxID=7038 RepID=UPI0008F9D36C|nr:PREDICTED: lipoma HMGIC fusion partner-like 2 protein isoform X2 [Bemisia tabaci]